MPAGAKLLCVQVQQAIPCLWAMVDPGAIQVQRIIRMWGTGHCHEMSPGEYVGTFRVVGGNLVFHVFDGGEA